MNCPMCGSEIPAGVKYCPVCGGDVEAARVRAQQAPVQQPLQYTQPRQQVAQPAQPVQRAVPMTASTPQPQAFKEIDTRKMEGAPKWPIILIIVLLAIIAALVLLIFHPWDAGSQGVQPNTGGVVVNTQPVADDAAQPAADTEQTVTVDEAPGTDAVQAPGVLSNEEAYTQLTASYNQLDGFHTQISSIALEFSNSLGVSDLTDLRNRAAALQGQIADAAAALNGLAVAGDSPYAGTKASIADLYNDLSMRISVLVEACDAVNSGGDYSAILSRDNGPADEHGHTNVYLIHYEQNHDAARPVAL